MKTIDEVMTAGHRTCDRHYAEAEAAVADEDWPGAEDAWSHFSRLLDKHVTVLEEEQIFYPMMDQSITNAADFVRELTLE